MVHSAEAVLKRSNNSPNYPFNLTGNGFGSSILSFLFLLFILSGALLLCGCNDVNDRNKSNQNDEPGIGISGTILFSNSPPSISLTEGDSYAVSISLSKPSTQPLSVTWEVVGGSGDFSPHMGISIISQGTSNFEINLNTIDNSTNEDIKSFPLMIVGSVGIENSLVLMIELSDEDQMAPPNPTSPLATTTSSTAIALSWISGGGTSLDYRISYQSGATAPASCSLGSTIDETAINGLTHAVTGLTPATQYSFRICAINGNNVPNVSSGVTVSAVTDYSPDNSGPGPISWVQVPDVSNGLSTGEIFLFWSGQGIDTESGIRDYKVEQFTSSDCSGSPTFSVMQTEANGWYNLQAGSNSLNITPYDKSNNAGTPTCSGEIVRITPTPLITGFGINGFKIFESNFGNSGFSDALVLPNDQILVSGWIYFGHHPKPLLGRLNSDGSWDTTFGGEGKGYRHLLLPGAGVSYGAKLAIQVDGKIIQAGHSTDQGLGYVARYNANGTLDSSFGNGGFITVQIGANDTDLNAAVVMSNGKIGVSGSINNGGVDQTVVIRLDQNGRYDPLFNTTGYISFDILGQNTRSLTIAEGTLNSLVVAGDNANSAQLYIAKISSAGVLDSGFGTSGITVLDPSSNNDTLHDLKVLADGKMLAAGSMDNCGLLMRFQETGVLDSSFGTGGFSQECVSETYRKAFIRPGGKIAAVGNNSLLVAQFSINGVLDSGFGHNGVNELWASPLNAYGESGGILSTGEIIVVGGGWHIKNHSSLIGMYNSDGTPSNLFGTYGVKSYSNMGKDHEELAGLKVRPGTDKLIFGLSVQGDYGWNYSFTQTDSSGVLDSTFAHGGKDLFDVSNSGGDNLDRMEAFFLNTDGTLSAAGSGWGSSSEMSSGRWTATGLFDITFNGIGSLTLSQANSQTAYGLTVQPDGKTILTGYSGGSNLDLRVVRLTTSGALDTSFNGTGIVTTSFGSNYDEGIAVAVQADGMIVTVGTKADNAGIIARYTSTGTLDSGFNSSGTITVNRSGREYLSDLFIQGDAKIVTSGVQDASFTLSRYNTDGSADLTFGATSGYTVIDFPGFPSNCDSSRMLRLNDGSFLLVGTIEFGGNYRDIGVAKLTSGGLLDTSFNGTGTLIINLGGTDDVGVEAVQLSDNSVVVGFRTNRDGQYDFGAFKINP
jgi:uncharacterized delta-60 repeat protein